MQRREVTCPVGVGVDFKAHALFTTRCLSEQYREGCTKCYENSEQGIPGGEIREIFLEKMRFYSRKATGGLLLFALMKKCLIPSSSDSVFHLS